MNLQLSAALVLPDLMNVPRPMWRDANAPYGDPINKAEIEAATHFNLAVAEMVRLNTPISPVEPHHYFRYDNLAGRYITITPAEYEDWGKDNRPEDAYAPAYAAPVAASDVPCSVRDALARRCLWLAFCWNDHNFGPAHKVARKEALQHGITSFDEANEWLSTAPAPTAEPDMIDLVFDGELPNAVFVEAEDGFGNSINVGDWFKREDGYWILRIKPVEPAHSDVIVPRELLKLIDEAMCDFLGEDDPLLGDLRALLAGGEV
jgi:hypothetical protein